MNSYFFSGIVGVVFFIIIILIFSILNRKRNSNYHSIRSDEYKTEIYNNTPEEYQQSIYLWENNGMTKKIKHLEMIETIIERMAKNCFQLKTWTMTLLTAIAALFSKESDQRFMLFIFIPVIGFWLMDTFYLQMERKYRFLYKNVAEKDENDIDFNLDTDFASGTSSDMKQLCFFRCMFSITEMLFYPVILVATAVFFLIIF